MRFNATQGCFLCMLIVKVGIMSCVWEADFKCEQPLNIKSNELLPVLLSQNLLNPECDLIHIASAQRDYHIAAFGVVCNITCHLFKGGEPLATGNLGRKVGRIDVVCVLFTATHYLGKHDLICNFKR